MNNRQQVMITVDGHTHTMDDIYSIEHREDGSVSLVRYGQGIVKVLGPGCYEEITVVGYGGEKMVDEDD